MVACFHSSVPTLWVVYPGRQYLHKHRLRHERLQAYTKLTLWSLCGHQDNQLPDVWDRPWVHYLPRHPYRRAPAGVAFWKHQGQAHRRRTSRIRKEKPGINTGIERVDKEVAGVPKFRRAIVPPTDKCVCRYESLTTPPVSGRCSFDVLVVEIAYYDEA